MKNKRSLPLLLLAIWVAAIAPIPAAALQCKPRSFGNPLANIPSPEWLDLIAHLDALRRENRIERVQLKVFKIDRYGTEPPEKFRDREELVPLDWSELAVRLEQFRGDRSSDVRMEVSDTTFGYDREPFLVIQGGPVLSVELTDGRTGAILYRAIAVGTDLSEIVGCY